MRTETEKRRAAAAATARRHVRPCPTAHYAADHQVVLCAPNPAAVRFGDIEQDRVHDRDTLRGACMKAATILSPAWARARRQREDVIQDACVIALSKLARAAEACPGATPIIPEGLVHVIVRGVLRHRSQGDGRYMATESAAAREILIDQWSEHLAAGGPESPRGYHEMARDIADACPIGRRPTWGYEWAWIETPYGDDLESVALREQHDGPQDPTMDAALALDPETCPADITSRTITTAENRRARGAPSTR